ncbi:MAG: B12-binding domain-containing radical SAM protein [Desulfobacteraceae bacterium]|nr:B12-binding domain-containing radical SAM protein [Desulfobacteraceae bacterium]MBC2720356.1 B12-binding domain-containing radical SAM protein [Desulfobacteraceae bacterium]
MKYDTPNILLVNPWIHDFAAYDFWAKPLGLLSLASILKQHGFSITYIDCLDRFHPKAPHIDPCTRNGRGPFLKTTIPKPKGLEHIPRNFSRYGIMLEWFREELKLIPKPDIVLVTSCMTYWYPGVKETIKIIKETYSDIIVILGGIYAGLCNEHAASHSGADIVLAGPGEKHILKLAENYTGFSVSPRFDPDDLDTFPYPAFDLQRKISYIPILTSKGCPFSCSYCASHFLNPKRMLRSPISVIEEIKHWHFKYNVKNFVFYDDALLVDAERHAVVLFEGLIKENLNVCFHTPNAVHIREISEKTASLMFRAGFKTIRLGLETAIFENRKELDSKVTANEFKQAVACLNKAGFQKNQVGAYLLTGLPGQTISSVEKSIREVKKNGITPVLAHYSPVPHTALWDRAVASSSYDLEADPVFTNNAIFPCWFKDFSWEKISYLKNLASI